ncbi:MBL fold metallo-hydrolase [Primorskyibacter sp. S187A]|uniref:MBL fold metallo-hydrolase n=1 Tax=Primorskyibacter sp. S187A TaxID=3415130 RepID=UPI003C79B6AC
MTKPILNRRQLITAAASAGVISTAFATTGKVAQAASHAATPMAGMITIHKLGAVTLHSYTAPEASALVNTHIIETANELHIIDAQFLQSFASEVRAYADSLGKPIKQLYLSHAHPDHLLGAAQFADVPFVTSDAVRADAEASTDMFEDRKAQFGDDTPLYMPEGGLGLGATSWGGVAVEIAEIKDAEAANTLTFHIPEAGLVIAQDLLYANAHAFPLGNTPNWIAALEGIRATDDLRLVGAGHGLPASPGALDDAIAYLIFQNEVITSSGDAETAVAALSEAYPGYGGAGLLNFVSYRY